MTSSTFHLEARILTFGYGNRKSYDAFSQYLDEYDVKYVIDVRTSPRAWSRRWYSQQIDRFCQLKNVRYISKTHLGNLSKTSEWIPPDRDKAKTALQEVAELTRNGNVLLLCAEMNPDRCHRVEVAKSLEQLVRLPIVNLK